MTQKICQIRKVCIEVNTEGEPPPGFCGVPRYALTALLFKVCEIGDGARIGLPTFRPFFLSSAVQTFVTEIEKFLGFFVSRFWKLSFQITL